MEFPKRLVDGYRAFLDVRLPVELSRFQRLAASGQQPAVMVIGCCDSRVSPEVIFDSLPGELFVVRNVANLVPPYSPSGLTHGVSAALEFAVQGLKVRYIIVMGHSHCGGVRAFAENHSRGEPGDFIGKWMQLIAPAAAALGNSTLDTSNLTCLEQASVVMTMSNLLTFPWIRSRVEAGELELAGAYFDVATGALSAYDPSIKKFLSVIPADGQSQEVSNEIEAPDELS